MQGNRYDAVLAHMLLAGFVGRVAAATASEGQVAYVCHAFGFYPARRMHIRAAYRLWEVGLSLLTDSIVVLNEHDWDYVRCSRFAFRNVDKYKLRSVGVDGSKLLEEIGGTDPAAKKTELGLARDARVVTFVGRFIKEKGILRFLRIAEDFPADESVHFVIVGDGPLRDEVVRGVGHLKVQGRVHVLGWREDVPQILAMSDVVCLPSENEGSSVVLQEAMVCGAAIVASRVPGCVDVIEHGETGLLVELENIGGYVNGIRSLLENEGLAASLKESARRVARSTFDCSVVAPEWARTIERIAERKKHSTKTLRVLKCIRSVAGRTGTGRFS